MSKNLHDKLLAAAIQVTRYSSISSIAKLSTAVKAIENEPIEQSEPKQMTAEELFDKIYSLLEDVRILDLLKKVPQLNDATAEGFWHLSKKEATYEIIEFIDQFTQSTQVNAPSFPTKEQIDEFVSIGLDDASEDETNLFQNGKFEGIQWLKQSLYTQPKEDTLNSIAEICTKLNKIDVSLEHSESSIKNDISEILEIARCVLHDLED